MNKEKEREKKKMEMTCAFGTPGRMTRCSNAQSILQVANMLDAEPRKQKQIVIYKPSVIEVYDLQYGSISNLRRWPRCEQQMQTQNYFAMELGEEKTHNDLLRYAAVLAQSQFIIVFKRIQQNCDAGFAWLGQNLLFVRCTNTNDIFYIGGLEHQPNAKLHISQNT